MFWILLMILAFLLLKGLFKIALSLLFCLLMLRMIIGTVAFFLSAEVLVPMLLITIIIIMLRKPKTA